MSQKGNALFLILIAVVLFAALSYAVTQSGRSGGGVDKEQAIIAAAKLTQYGSAVHTAITRMILTGTTVANLDLTEAGVGENAVFAPEGGGVAWQVPTSDMGAGTVYSFSSGKNITNIGTVSNEVTMTLSGMKFSVCEQINKNLGLSISPIQSDSNIFDNTYDAYPGEAFFCFNNSFGAFIYLHTFVEQ